MELKVGRGTSGPFSRWQGTGGASLRWGSGAASEGRTLEDNMALLERVRSRPSTSTAGGPRLLHRASVSRRTLLRIRAF